MNARMIGAGFMIAGLTALGACSGSGEDASGPEIELPAWIEAGDRVEDGAGGRVFFAVGKVDGIKNPGLARTTAANRARAGLVRLLEANPASETPDSTPAARPAVASASLRGVTIAQYWIHPVSRTFYALARYEVPATNEDASTGAPIRR